MARINLAHRLAPAGREARDAEPSVTVGGRGWQTLKPEMLAVRPSAEVKRKGRCLSASIVGAAYRFGQRFDRRQRWNNGRVRDWMMVLLVMLEIVIGARLGDDPGTNRAVSRP